MARIEHAILSTAETIGSVEPDTEFSEVVRGEKVGALGASRQASVLHPYEPMLVVAGAAIGRHAGPVIQSIGPGARAAPAIGAGEDCNCGCKDCGGGWGDPHPVDLVTITGGNLCQVVCTGVQIPVGSQITYRFFMRYNREEDYIGGSADPSYSLNPYGPPITITFPNPDVTFGCNTIWTGSTYHDQSNRRSPYHRAAIQEARNAFVAAEPFAPDYFSPASMMLLGFDPDAAAGEIFGPDVQVTPPPGQFVIFNRFIRCTQTPTLTRPVPHVGGLGPRPYPRI